jgi:hypothetical protein
MTMRTDACIRSVAAWSMPCEAGGGGRPNDDPLSDSFRSARREKSLFFSNLFFVYMYMYNWTTL